MPSRDDLRPADEVVLRFTGEDGDGTDLHELRAAHVAEVLQGVVALASDFSKAGAFGNNLTSEVLVRPATEGSFIIEVVRWATENPELAVAASTTPTGIGTVIFWATKSLRAQPRNIEYLDNDMVKVEWQDDTVDEIPAKAWKELSSLPHRQRRKKQLRQIMAPLSDERVNALQVTPDSAPAQHSPPTALVLTKDDYHAARVEDEIEEFEEVMDVEAQMSAVNFDNPAKWRVRATIGGKPVIRNATMEDEEFLARVKNGRPIGKSDIFRLELRQDTLRKNGRNSRTWSVVQVVSHRRAAHDDEE